LISFRNHPPHLSAGIGCCHPGAVEVLQQIVQEVGPVAEAKPGIHLARVQSERQRGAEREGRVLAPIVVEGGIAHLDSTVLHGVEHLQPRHELASGKHLNLELVIGDLGHALGEVFASAKERIQRFRPTRCKSPFHLRHRLGDSRRGDRGRRHPNARRLEKFPSFHVILPVGPWPCFFWTRSPKLRGV